MTGFNYRAKSVAEIRDLGIGGVTAPALHKTTESPINIDALKERALHNSSIRVAAIHDRGLQA